MYEDILVFPGKRDTAPFQVLMCGVSYCDGTYRINRPNSRLWCFEYIRKGTGTVHVGNISFQASAGDIYILPAGKDHVYFSDEKEPWEKVWFNIQGPFIENAVKAYGLENTFHVQGLNLNPLFEEFLSTAQNVKQSKSSNWSFDPCAGVFLKIVQAISSAPERLKQYTPETRIHRLKHRIDNLTDFSISFDALLEEFFYTKSHMIRTFKAEFGVTPYNYLLEVKLNTAKLLLKNTAMTVTEIAAYLGFSSCHHFSGFFSKRTGVSPTVYRDA